MATTDFTSPVNVLPFQQISPLATDLGAFTIESTDGVVSKVSPVFAVRITSSGTMSNSTINGEKKRQQITLLSPKFPAAMSPKDAKDTPGEASVQSELSVSQEENSTTKHEEDARQRSRTRSFRAMDQLAHSSSTTNTATSTAASTPRLTQILTSPVPDTTSTSKSTPLPRPVSPFTSSYNVDVLGLSPGMTEDALDAALTSKAANLNLNVSPNPKEVIRRPMTSGNGLQISFTPTTEFADTFRDPSFVSALTTTPTSHNSWNLRTSGDSSREGVSTSTASIHTSATAATTMTAASTLTSSTSSRSKGSSAMSMFKSSIRRLSNMSNKRRPSLADAPVSSISSSNKSAITLGSLKSSSLSTRPSTSFLRGTRPSSIFSSRQSEDDTPNFSRPRVIDTEASISDSIVPTLKSARSNAKHKLDHHPSVPSIRAASILQQQTPKPQIIVNRPMSCVEEEEREPVPESAVAKAARERSLKCPDLIELRKTQMEEQALFLRFQHEQITKIRADAETRAADEKEKRQLKRQDLEVSHLETEAKMETKHLAAEEELMEQFELEKRNCYTALRHMVRYCFGDSMTVEELLPEGGNARTEEELVQMRFANSDASSRKIVSSQDIRALTQQQNLAKTIDVLHAGRLNVLREQQSRQLERLAIRHETELENLTRQEQMAAGTKDTHVDKEIKKLRSKLERRRARLVWRWNVAEEVERKRLEDLYGVKFGPVPPLEWSDLGDGLDESL